MCNRTHHHGNDSPVQFANQSLFFLRAHNPRRRCVNVFDLLIAELLVRGSCASLIGDGSRLLGSFTKEAHVVCFVVRIGLEALSERGDLASMTQRGDSIICTDRLSKHPRPRRPLQIHFPYPVEEILEASADISTACTGAAPGSRLGSHSAAGAQ